MDYALHAECLVSKWGFDDGDGLQHYLYDLKDLDLINDVPERDEFLYRVVSRYLLPELERRGIKVMIYKISSSHNPVRTDTVNGIEIDQRSGEAPDCLRDIEVRVPRNEIVLMAIDMLTEEKKNPSVITPRA